MNLLEKKKNNLHIYFVYFSVLILVFTWLFNAIHLENIDIDILQRILDPNIEKGVIAYDPQYNYLYLISLFITNSEFEINNSLLIKIIWVIEKILFIYVSSKFIKLIYSNYNLRIFIIFSILYILLQKSGEVDQKTFTIPFQFLAIYYFIKGRFFKSSLSISFVFYFHVGMGVWWYLPSIFSFIFLFLTNEKNYTFLNFFKYNSYTSFLIFPLIYFYFFRENNIDLFYSDYLKGYWIGINNSIKYLLYNKNYNEILIIILKLFIYLFSISIIFKNNKSFYNKFLSILFGVIFLFLINEIITIVIESGFVLKLQLLRSIEILHYISMIIISILIYNQLRGGNPLFFILLLIILIPNPFWFLLNYFNLYIMFYTLCLIILLNELINRKSKKIKKFGFFLSLFNSFLRILSNNNNYLYIIILFLAFANLNYYFNLQEKILLLINNNNVKNNNETVSINHQSVIDYINNDLNFKNSYIAVPFLEGDMSYIIRKKTFISINNPYDYIPVNSKIMFDIFNKELELTIKNVRDKEEMYKIWSNLNITNFLRWKETYGLTHIIREKNLPLDLPIIFSDNEYNLYKINNFSE